MEYLSSKVIWRYVMVAFLLLVENRRLPYPRSPLLSSLVLHLVYESATHNKAMHLTVAFGARR